MKTTTKFYSGLACLFISGLLIDSSGLILAICFISLGIGAAFIISGNLDLERRKAQRRSRAYRRQTTQNTIRRVA